MQIVMDEGAPNADRLRALVADILRVPAGTITDELDMDATSTWDSLSHMSLIAAIEDEFHFELTLDEIVGMTTFAKIRAVLTSKSAAS